MKINSKEKIAGFPLLKIRDLLQREKALNATTIASFIKTNEKKANEILKELTTLRYIEPVNNQKFYTHEITLLGNSFSLSKAISPISKEKANQLLEKFMERVHHINHDNYYLYKVEKVIVFGSFISDKPFINDIDLAIEFVRKEPDKDKAYILEQKRISEAQQKGKVFNNFIEELYYPTREVLLFLKARSPYISIHSSDDGILETANLKQIFPDFK